MNKEELIALGLNEEQAVKVTEKYEHMVTKTRFDEVVTEKNDLKKQVEERDKQLSELSKNNASNEELKKQIEILQAENKTKDEEYQANISKIKLDNALELALNNAGSKNNTALKALLKLENIKLDNDKLIGFDEQIAEIKKTADYLFKVEEKTPITPTGTTPQVGNGGTVENKITLGSALAGIYSNK